MPNEQILLAAWIYLTFRKNVNCTPDLNQVQYTLNNYITKRFINIKLPFSKYLETSLYSFEDIVDRIIIEFSNSQAWKNSVLPPLFAARYCSIPVSLWYHNSISPPCRHSTIKACSMLPFDLVLFQIHTESSGKSGRNWKIPQTYLQVSISLWFPNYRCFQPPTTQASTLTVWRAQLGGAAFCLGKPLLHDAHVNQPKIIILWVSITVMLF